MLEIEKSHLAEQDLIDIWIYSCERWGDSQADSYLDQIEEVLRKVSQFPELGEDCSHLKTGYRKIEAGRHDVFYIIDEEVIFIVRILHQSRKYEYHL